MYDQRSKSHILLSPSFPSATMVQIRKGVCGKTAQQLVRIPQVDARSKFYVEAAKAIGEREALALPYHGSRMWKCEVKVCFSLCCCFLCISISGLFYLYHTPCSHMLT